MINFCEPYTEPDLPDVLADQVRSGFLGPGQKCQEFEQALCDYTGAAYCVLTNSGTTALTLTAHALGITGIVLPAYGVAAVINAFAVTGRDVELVDIARATGCISYSDLWAKTWKRPALCHVAFSGNMDEWGPPNYAQEESMFCIVDAACAIQNMAGLCEGESADAYTLSFSVPKVITTGQGGAVLTNSHRIAEQVRNLTDQGAGYRQGNITGPGLNYRLSDLQAAIGLHQLRNISARTARKQAAFDVLADKLGDKLYCLDEGVPLHNIVFAADPDSLVAELQNAGIDARRQYRTYNQHPAYKHLQGHFPNADWWTDHAVYLPFGMALTPEQAEQIADAVLASGETLLENAL